MILLFIASLIWAFSPGLLKQLSIRLDPYMLGILRIGFAFLASLPFLWKSSLTVEQKKLWIKVGFIQIGIMYAPYLVSFHYLKAHEVALFTMTTPIYVALIESLKTRTFERTIIMAAGLAIAGGVVVAYEGLESFKLLHGAALIQISNILFAYGQSLIKDKSFKTLRTYADTLPFYFFGAILGSLLCFIGSVIWTGKIHWVTLSSGDWLILAWLGVVASGVGFWIWNRGVMSVNAAQLAVATDFKLPLGIAVSLSFFGESADTTRLALGTALLGIAGVIAKPKKPV